MAQTKFSFQSTPPHGERLLQNCSRGWSIRFQSTPPHGERPASCGRRPRGKLFQSTPPHGERPDDQVARVGHLPVSIHAPARGATLIAQEAHRGIPVSIHAPARGATRRPCGSICTLLVSIHAPARGATLASVCWMHVRCCFNPRPRTGSDHGIDGSARGGIGFNPRPRTGSDLAKVEHLVDLLVSIHAPARGATLEHSRRKRQTDSFNPRPRTGSDYSPTCLRWPQTCFNPRPRTGSDAARPLPCRAH